MFLFSREKNNPSSIIVQPKADELSLRYYFKFYLNLTLNYLLTIVLHGVHFSLFFTQNGGEKDV
ncbi:hypothetical protein EFQ99_11850 [Rhizobium vallis]|uniref:Uncharacterized protein n=1 Tax=Rhizobium vallis TaxID=634290 RepID=A0A3S0T6E1_9HYPH|nr:hypothetical protein EFQ99_11850 [Rhizobium vallis]